MQTQPTTPFGRRSLSLAMVASQASARDFAGKPGSLEAIVHKWRLFRALTEAKTPLGVTDRALSVLHALLSFHQETALTLPAADRRADDKDGEGSAGIVVFPSNRELSIRAHGMAPATLRRHLACLVEAGLIIRRNSPNGKRYARRGQGGEIENAFGFDLTPLVARADEIENLAEEVRAENKEIRLLRERVTLLRRDIVKMIAAGLEEGVPGDWQGLHLRYAALSSRFARNLSRADLGALASELAVLNAEIQKALENHVNLHKKSGNESHSERHIQNQITNSFDLEPGLQKGRAETLPSNDQGPPSPSAPSRRTPIIQNPRRPKPILSAWCWRPVPISSITPPRAGSTIGAIWRRRRRRCGGPSGCRRTLGRRPWRSWANTTRPSSSPRSCSGAMRSKAPAAICGF